ncbi:MAG: WYL domain-containing protein, partial [Myxococcota bacterium]
QLDVSADGPDSLAAISQAILERRELELEYVTIGRGDREQRRVRPLELFSHRGQWYLQAFCLTRNDERLFRVDRIGRVTLTDARFPEPEGVVRHVPGGASEKPVKVRFAPELAAWQQERFADTRLEADGSLIVTVPGDSERWLTRWVLSFGGGATVLEPAWAIRAVADAASASLKSA